MGAVDSSVRAVVWRWVRPGAIAAGQGLAVALLCLTTNVVLFALSVVSLALIPVFGIGFALFPAVTVLVRWSLTLQRRLSRWSRVPIASPYQPVPAGAQLGTWKRFRWVVGDPATWRDFAWLIPGAVTGGACLLAFVLPAYGLEGVLLVPVVLYLTIDWYGYGIFWPMDNFVQAWLSIPQGWLILGGGLAVAPWLVWLHFRFAGFFLAPTRAQELALRVRHLAATRADTIDTQAAELRRIERDLHDGAQARLVALSMQLGRAERRLAIERPVADEGELTNAPVVLIDDAADRLGIGRMAHAVEDDLRHRAAAFERLVSRFVIDGLGEAQQRSPLVDVAARHRERPGRVQRTVGEGQRGVDQLGLLADRLHLVGRIAAGRVDQLRGLGRRDRQRDGRGIGRIARDERDGKRRGGSEEHAGDHHRFDAQPGERQLRAANGFGQRGHDAFSFFAWAAELRCFSTSSRGPSAMILPPSITISRLMIDSMLWRCVATTSVWSAVSAVFRCSMK